MFEGWDWNQMMYLLGAAGGAMGGQGSWQQALGSGAQQHIAANSFANQVDKDQQMVNQWLQGFLKMGGQMTMNKDGLTIKAPMEAAGGVGLGSNMGAPPAGIGPQNTAAVPQRQMPLTSVSPMDEELKRKMATGLLNPFGAL